MKQEPGGGAEELGSVGGWEQLRGLLLWSGMFVDLEREKGQAAAVAAEEIGSMAACYGRRFVMVDGLAPGLVR